MNIFGQDSDLEKVSLSFILRPALYGVYVLCALLLIVMLEEQLVSSSYFWRNVVTPVVLTCVCWGVGFFVIVRFPSAIWSPIPWFLGRIGLTYGVGAMFYTFGNEESIAFRNVTWFVSDEMLWKANQLGLLATIVVLLFFVLFSFLFPRFSRIHDPEKIEASVVSAKKMVFIFLLIGVPMKYFLLLPYDLGLISFVVPGVFRYFGTLTYASLFLLGYLAVKLGNRWNILFLSFLSVELLVALLSFNKSMFFLVIITASVGRFFAHGRIRSLIYLGLFMLVVYFPLKTLVANGRGWLVNNTSQKEQTLGTRLEGLGQIVAKEQEQTNLQYGWMRLSYVDVTTFVMEQYDSGFPGNSFDAAKYVLIPRIVWPEKPIISNIGTDFTVLFFGRRLSTSTGLGIYGEAYWNGGYLYVFMTSIYIAFLLVFLSFIVIRAMESFQWIFLPIAYMCIQLGVAGIGWFSVTYVGGIGILFVYMLFLYVIKLFFLPEQKAYL